jgi:hypothetical protein
MAQLPADLLADSLRPVTGGQSSRLRRICGGTQGMRPHMGDACGLPCSSGGGRSDVAYLTGGGMSETVADSSCDVELATSKGAGPGDGITRAAIPRSFGLEQSQRPLRAVRRPHRDDPPVSFAQCLRRTHAPDVPTP